MISCVTGNVPGDAVTSCNAAALSTCVRSVQPGKLLGAEEDEEEQSSSVIHKHPLCESQGLMTLMAGQSTCAHSMQPGTLRG